MWFHKKLEGWGRIYQLKKQNKTKKRPVNATHTNKGFSRHSEGNIVPYRKSSLFDPIADCFASTERTDLWLRWMNVYTTDRTCLGSVNSTFTAMICPLGTCRIFSTTPYAPRPSSIMGSRSSAFTSKFCKREE